MIEKVKLALRITTDAFDEEINDLIAAAQADLGIAGVNAIADADPLLTRAIVTFCRAHFGQPDDYDRIKKAYDEQKAQLQMATGYTNWGDTNG